MEPLTLITDLGMLYITENSIYKKRFGIYKCYCGNEFKANTSDVKANKIVSCGCSREASNTSHRLYATWTTMRKRCNDINSISYKNYGALGIKVCKEWDSFEQFLVDMEPTFQEGLTLDRIKNDKGYSKENCRWSTNEVQRRHTRMLYKHNKSGYRGVRVIGKNFTAYIRVSNKDIHLGTFSTAVEAAIAFNSYVIANNLEHTLNTL